MTINSDLDRFTAAYIAATYFSDTGEGDQPPSDAELAPDTRLDIEADCRSFWRRFGCYITTDICRDAFDGNIDAIEQAGYDFHFTRNHHGAGFWEPEWPECYRDMLTKGAHCYGAFDIYQGDDGLIYA